MVIYLDCLPCLLKQTLEASKFATDSTDIQEKVMELSLKAIAGYRNYASTTEIARDIHRFIKQYTGASDPYRQLKQENIQSALELYPVLKRNLDGKEDRLYWALKTAATGNSIDFALFTHVDVEACVKEELQIAFALCDIDIFKKQLENAKTLLVIGDNAGETVFDRVLLEELPLLDITYAVRSAPIVNDATKEDALASGLDSVSKVISSGCNAPGLLIEECSEEFLHHFYAADIVISKGQGNYEALINPKRSIFYILKAKCPIVSRLLGVNLGEYALEYKE